MAIIIIRSSIMKFLVDSMLGRLAKWLRIMGYDTHYQRSYRLSELYKLSKQDRIFLSKDRRLIRRIGGLLINSDKIDDQIKELKEKLDLKPDKDRWFSRCIICNTKLDIADPEYAKEFVPEYVFIQNKDRIRFCSLCNRFYWPGTHRERMISQLKKWGF